MTFFIMGCHCHLHHIIPMAQDTDASTDTSTGTKSHIIHLNNQLYMTNAMVSLRAISASCDRKHFIAMYVPKFNMPLKCYI